MYDGSTQPRTMGWQQMLQQATATNPIFVIVDEVQLSYIRRADFPFWRIVKNSMGAPQPSMIFLLLAAANVSQEPGMSTPFKFPDENTLCFEDMKLKAEDRTHIFHGACKIGQPLASVMNDQGITHNCCIA